jgi:hypothetical protein
MNRSWIGLAFVALVAAVVGIQFFFGANPYGGALETREIATRGLAQALVARHPGKRVIILSNPFIKRPETDRRIVAMEEAGVRGLRSGLEGKLTIDDVVYPELRPEARENPRAVAIDTETTTPLSYLVATDAFDRAALEHPDAEILISLIGLPIELDKCEVWKKEGPPSFALLLPDLRMLGSAAAVAAAVKSGKLTAIVLARPNAGADEKAGPDFKAEFERRYVLVTSDNVDELVRQSPELLQSP